MSAPISPPKFEADHVSWTVENLDEIAALYTKVFGAKELFRMGPFDAAEIPVGADGRDWTESHINVAGARVSLVMLQLTPTLNLQFIQYDKPADRNKDLPRNCDRGGHHLALRVADVPAAIAYLEDHGFKAMDLIEMSEGPLAGHVNVYVLDPWGHQLEIVD